MNRMTYLFSLLLVLTLSQGFAQTDPVKVEYTYFPQEDSDNSFRRFKAALLFPIKTGKDSYLLPGVEYENIHFKFKDPTPFVKGEDLDRYQSFGINLGYTFKWNVNWRVGALAGILVASNFERDAIINDDLLYTGAFLLIKDRTQEKMAEEKPWRLIVGLHYSTTSGFPFPLPVVNYYREFQPNWSYTLGVPKTNIVYDINSKHGLQAFVTLDGFYANLQNNREFDNSPKVAENISMTIVLGGIGYEYSFNKHLVYYLYAGHTIRNDIRLRNGDRDEVLQVNEENTFYGRTGIKIKI